MCPSPLNASKASRSASIHSVNSGSLSLADVVVAPSALHVLSTKAELTANVKVSTQNIYSEAKGAYTGETRSINTRVPSCSTIHDTSLEY